MVNNVISVARRLSMAACSAAKRCALPLALVCGAVVVPSTAAGQEDSPPRQVESTDDSEQPLPVAPKLFALGDFYVREVRQTRNETVDVRFSLYLLLPPETSDQLVAQLQHRLQRLREQIIVAVRLTEMIDFLQPGLDRLQLIMRIRIQRLLGPGVIDGLYINDFILGDN